MGKCIVNKQVTVTIKTGKNNLFKTRVNNLYKLLVNKEIDKNHTYLLSLNGFNSLYSLEKIRTSSMIKITLEDESFIKVDPETKLTLLNNTSIKASELSDSHVLLGRKKIKSIEKFYSNNNFEMFLIIMRNSNSLFINDNLIEF